MPGRGVLGRQLSQENVRGMPAVQLLPSILHLQCLQAPASLADDTTLAPWNILSCCDLAAPLSVRREVRSSEISDHKSSIITQHRLLTGWQAQ